MDVSARFSQTFNLQMSTLVGHFQGSIIKPLIDNRAMVDLSATLRSRRKDEFSVWERGAQCLGFGNFCIEEWRTKDCGVGSPSVEDDECLLVLLKRWCDQTFRVSRIRARFAGSWRIVVGHHGNGLDSISPRAEL